MSEWTRADVEKIRARQQQTAAPQSKYKNVKTVVDGITFDSKREAQYWHGLKAREKAGQIHGLERQVSFPLFCPVLGTSGMQQTVAWYISDFVFKDDAGVRHVVDAKGKRTALYAMKAKWLFLQEGIIVEEV